MGKRSNEAGSSRTGRGQSVGGRPGVAVQVADQRHAGVVPIAAGRVPCRDIWKDAEREPPVTFAYAWECPFGSPGRTEAIRTSRKRLEAEAGPAALLPCRLPARPPADGQGAADASATFVVSPVASRTDAFIA